MLRYDFTITIGAEANTPEEAWEEALLGLALDPGAMPNEDEYSVEPVEDPE